MDLDSRARESANSEPKCGVASHPHIGSAHSSILSYTPSIIAAQGFYYQSYNFVTISLLLNSGTKQRIMGAYVDRSFLHKKNGHTTGQSEELISTWM
jgi:hypothetical protein